MTLRRLPQHAVLEQTTRLPLLVGGERALPALELLALLLFGGLAACSMLFLDFGVRVPGHAILRAVLPMACGLAVVPRRGAGLVMGGGVAFNLGGAALGRTSRRGNGIGIDDQLAADRPDDGSRVVVGQTRLSLVLEFRPRGVCHEFHRLRRARGGQIRRRSRSGRTDDGKLAAGRGHHLCGLRIAGGPL